MKTSNKCRLAMAKSYHSILKDMAFQQIQNENRKAFHHFGKLIDTFHIGALMSMKVDDLHDRIINALIMRNVFTAMDKMQGAIEYACFKARRKQEESWRRTSY